VVLGFPSNDFGYQEPGTEKEIKTFCEMTYGVDFPMFSKTRVTKQNADPLYKKLAKVSGIYPQWNFHKYLIGGDGEFIKSYNSSVDPMDEQVISVIKKELKKVKL
jgi:glutathione peroxidase